MILLVIGLMAGLLSGFVGVGGGIIIVPALVFFLGYTQLGAQGTSLAVLLAPVGIFAVMNYYKAGHINVNSAIVICLAFVVGAYFGSKLAIGISQQMVKRVFAIFMMVVAVKMLFGK